VGGVANMQQKKIFHKQTNFSLDIAKLQHRRGVLRICNKKKIFHKQTNFSLDIAKLQHPGGIQNFSLDKKNFPQTQNYLKFKIISSLKLSQV